MRKLPFRQADDKDCVPFQPFCLMNGGQCQGFLILIIGFGACMVAALMAFVATLCIKGLQNEPWECVKTTFFKWGKLFYLTNFLAVGGAGGLLVGVK